MSDESKRISARPVKEHKIIDRVKCLDGYYHNISIDGRCMGCGRKLRVEVDDDI
jgi:hypothetical protein